MHFVVAPPASHATQISALLSVVRPAALSVAILCLAGHSLIAADTKPLLDLSAFPASAFISEPNRFLHLQVNQPGKMESLFAQIPVAGLKALELTYKVRYHDVKRGAQSWFDARIIMDFKNAKGDTVGPGPAAPSFVGSSADWRTNTVRFIVPGSATQLNVMPVMFQAESGSMDIGELTVRAIDPALLAPTGGAAAADKAVRVDAGGKPPSAIHVDGNRILDATGAVVWLQGVNVPSLEWSGTGDSVLNSVVTAIEVWKANCIRLPVSGERWLGRHKEQKDGGTAYRALISQVVQAASTRGARLILDLHRFRAPTDEDVDFWKSASAAFKDDPAVIFGLFNEPHDISWQIWQNGGDVTDKKKSGDTLAENKESITTFHTPGIQALLDAARSTGAHNVILAGGLDWSYDLSGILDGHALDDHGGSGIIYDTHVYPWKGDWQHKFLAIADVHPVLLGEVGCDIKRYDFIPAERFENPYTWAPDMLACIQLHHLNWTAWSFHPGASPSVVGDLHDFIPTPYWGAFVRAALLGASFHSEKLR